MKFGFVEEDDRETKITLIVSLLNIVNALLLSLRGKDFSLENVDRRCSENSLKSCILYFFIIISKCSLDCYYIVVLHVVSRYVIEGRRRMGGNNFLDGVVFFSKF